MKNLAFLAMISGAPALGWCAAPASPDDAAAERIVRSEELVQQLTSPLRVLARSLVDGGWRDAGFGFLAASFEGDSTFITKTKFEGVRTDAAGGLVGIAAKHQLTWRRSGDGGWNLAAWEPVETHRDRSPAPYFEEVLDVALPDWIARDQARRSAQEELTVTALSEKRLDVAKPEYADLADMESSYQFPSVSVVDFDGDGHDDLCVTSRWTAPQLLRNLGDGTFKDVARNVGLDVENCVNTVLFADFDNDGDPDALLGRSIEPTLYFRNDGGRFREVTDELSDLGRQFFVSSMAAADVNRDGLLDVYLSTYSPGTDALPIWKERYLTPDQAEGLDALQSRAHPYFDDRGTPNVLLINRGDGRLERAGGEAVELWRKSYQPLWFDADSDGDDDLYICNDFAPDTFLRNDTPPGAPEPVLVDAFAEFFPDGEMAFGMGASAADFDRDGDLDLFVSNMYSKAGNRIAAAAGHVDPRILVAARGNFLYRNDGGTFHQVANADAPETKVGWAFGGQFADFDNDGLTDLYVPSGYYTAPSAVATEVDL